MKEKIFTKKERTIIIMILGVLAFAFFWYELRPLAAKNACLEKAEQFSRRGQSFTEIYTDCLFRKGY